MFPEINRMRKTSTYISVFRGLNRTANTGFSRISSNTSAVFFEFTDMENLCGDDYPKLRTRKKRYKTEGPEIVSNLLIADSRLIYMTGNGRMMVGNESVDFSAYYIEGAHRLTQFGNRVVVMPEKVMLDLSTKEIESIDFLQEKQGVGSSTLNVARYNSGNYANLTRRFRDFSIEKVELDDSGAPRMVNYIYENAAGLEDLFKQTNPANDTSTEEGIAEDWQGEYYLHWNTIPLGETVEAQGERPSGVYRCTEIIRGKNNIVTVDGVSYTINKNIRRFVKIENYYVKISRTQTAPAEGAEPQNLFDGLKKGDWVKISGMVHAVKTPLVIQVSQPQTPPTYWADVDGATAGKTDYPKGFWGNYLEVLNGNTFKVYYVGSDFIVIKANIEKSVPYTGPMKIERVMPAVDSGKMLEVNNRLWACSSAANEVYSCKQGDCTNWQAYGDGISTDSFAATVGCEGEFTGIARQNDSVIFFKENWIIKLFGNKPSNFALSTYNVLGVEQGSEKSVVWLNGALFYLSHMGVCQYAPGSQPVVISERAFGNEKYKNGVAGRHRNKYMISAQNESGEWELFAFDTDNGLWHKEDNTHMADCATYNNVLYYVDGDTGALVSCDEDNHLLTNGVVENDFDWSFETPNLYEDDFGKKYISKIQFAVKAAEDAAATVYAQFKHGGAWFEIKRLHYLRRQHSLTGIPVRRADYLRLKVEGHGEMEISGIQIDFARGSDKVWQF